MVSNFHYLNDFFGNIDSENDTILSVTVVKNHQLSAAEMVQQVKTELATHCKIETGKLLKMFHIKKALPKVNDLKYKPTKESLILGSGVFCCGDYLVNSSLNAAMTSGRVVADLVTSGVEV